MLVTIEMCTAESDEQAQKASSPIVVHALIDSSVSEVHSKNALAPIVLHMGMDTDDNAEQEAKA
jgi:hypothetical protein